jgi:hypothetical protein
MYDARQESVTIHWFSYKFWWRAVYTDSSPPHEKTPNLVSSGRRVWTVLRDLDPVVPQAFQARPFPPSSLNRSGRRCDDYLHQSTLRLVCVRVYLVINEPHCRKPCFFLRLYFLTSFLIIILSKPLKLLLLYSLSLT